MVLCVKQRRANWTKKVNKRSDNGAMCKTKKGQLDKRGNKRSDMVLCVKQRRANWTKEEIREVIWCYV